VVNHKKVDTYEQTRKHETNASIKLLSYLGGLHKKTAQLSELTYSPHDYKNLQVLAHLADAGFIKSHPDECAENDIILVKGNVTFYGSGLLKVFLTETIKMLADQMPTKTKEDRYQKTLISKSITMFNEFKFNSIYVMQNDQGYFMGAVKDSEMAEEINTYTFMLGPSTLQDTTLLGIVSKAGESLSLPVEHVLGIYQGVLNSFMMMLALPEAHFVTPIAIYQELNA